MLYGIFVFKDHVWNVIFKWFNGLLVVVKWLFVEYNKLYNLIH